MNTSPPSSARAPDLRPDLHGPVLPGQLTVPGNRLSNDGTWAYAYDQEGNLIKKTRGTGETWYYGYDYRNHLTSVMQEQTDGGTLLMQATYVYDAFANRIEKDVWTQTPGTVTTTRFAYDGPNIFADLSGSNQLLTRRIYLDGVDAVFARISSGGSTAWYLPDRLGSVRDITNASGAVQDHIDYDGFGNATESNPSFGDRYKWTGREFDSETELQFNRERYYDPKTGRWTTQDPMVFGAGDPNLYRYVLNAPSNALDPSGLDGNPLARVHPNDIQNHPEYQRMMLNMFSQIATPAWKQKREDDRKRAEDEGCHETDIVNIQFYKQLPIASDPRMTFAQGAVLAAHLVSVELPLTILKTGVEVGSMIWTPEAKILARIAGPLLKKGYGLVLKNGKPILMKIKGNIWRPLVKGEEEAAFKEIQAAQRAIKCTGQVHHVISKKIADALKKHPTLKGLYKPRDPRFTTRALDKSAHNGYEAWHRKLDDEVVKWLEHPDNQAKTAQEFEDWLRWLYSQPDTQWRFPNGF